MSDPMPTVRGILGMPSEREDRGERLTVALEALVEQQRVANLIAFMGTEGGPYEDINAIDRNRRLVIHDEIIVGLGI